MNLLITICARSGSKGIPGKNIKIIGDKPLVAYTIQSAQKFAKKFNADIGFSTDSIAILEKVSQFNLYTDYLRPFELATDTAGKIDVIKNLIEYQELHLNKKYDYILDLDITSPLRTQEDLEEAFNMLKANSEALNIFSVNPAARNPYFNMVEQHASGYVGLVKGGLEIKSRQKAPKVYDMNASFYFFRREFFSQGYESSITDKSLLYIMNHLCFDLDEHHDFVIMDLMMRNNLFDFTF
jgi:CMP-N,N'-diacetyllegionaminic acid synthase